MRVTAGVLSADLKMGARLNGTEKRRKGALVKGRKTAGAGAGAKSSLGAFSPEHAGVREEDFHGSEGNAAGEAFDRPVSGRTGLGP